LDILDRIEAGTARDALCDQFDDPQYGLLRVGGGDEVEIRLAIGRRQIRHLPCIDGVSRRNDLALCGLAKRLGADLAPRGARHPLDRAPDSPPCRPPKGAREPILRSSQAA